MGVTFVGTGKRFGAALIAERFDAVFFRPERSIPLVIRKNLEAVFAAHQLDHLLPQPAFGAAPCPVRADNRRIPVLHPSELHQVFHIAIETKHFHLPGLVFKPIEMAFAHALGFLALNSAPVAHFLTPEKPATRKACTWQLHGIV